MLMYTACHINQLNAFDELITDDEKVRRTEQSGSLESYFSRFRNNIVGHHHAFESPFGKKKMVYADWTASGRCYKPIEACIQNDILPFVANTHTGTTVTGSLMSKAYEAAKAIIKQHVHANSDDALIFCGSGTTAAVNKLQRILGLRIPERVIDYVRNDSIEDVEELRVKALSRNRTSNQYLQIDEALRPVVFVSHMEHHSNQVSWIETIATVEIIQPGKNGNVDIEHLQSLLEQYKHRKNKIAAVTAASNVTGIQTPYHDIATIMHEYDGLCFVDFACAAPYVHIDMHPAKTGAHLDAIYFSGHKFLGGPGTPGVLVFNKKMYRNTIPDQPGGGTVAYSNPWKEHEYVSDIEQREDGGTPPFLQAIKAAMCIRLKEEMGVENILRREAEVLRIIFERFSNIKDVEVLEPTIRKRLGVVSFIVKGAHHNLVVKILNDRFGIQTRGGCSCAGTYGHILLGVDKKRSYEILDSIRSGDLFCKPGWIRLSVHPTMSNAEIDFIMDAIEAAALHWKEWMKDYTYDEASNEYVFKGFEAKDDAMIEEWFNGPGIISK